MSVFSNRTAWLENHLGALLVAAFVAAGLFACWRVMVHAHRVDMLKVNNQSFTLQVADTPETQAEGLGDRASLPKNQGMLFVFDTPGQQCMWMKDMKFPLDMLWLDTNKRVVHIEQNVSPNTYPNSFCSDVPAKYVIELNAGTASHAGMQQGKALNF